MTLVKKLKHIGTCSIHSLLDREPILRLDSRSMYQRPRSHSILRTCASRTFASHSGPQPTSTRGGLFRLFNAGRASYRARARTLLACDIKPSHQSPAIVPKQKPALVVRYHWHFSRIRGVLVKRACLYRCAYASVDLSLERLRRY